MKKIIFAMLVALAPFSVLFAQTGKTELQPFTTGTFKIVNNQGVTIGYAYDSKQIVITNSQQKVMDTIAINSDALDVYNDIWSHKLYIEKQWVKKLSNGTKITGTDYLTLQFNNTVPLMEACLYVRDLERDQDYKAGFHLTSKITAWVQ